MRARIRGIGVVLTIVGLAAALGASPASAAFGISSFDGQVTSNPAGDPFTQAGGHPYEASTSFDLNRTVNSFGTLTPDGGGLRNVRVDLPAGFVGNPTATPRCYAAQALAELDLAKVCPYNSIVGLAHLRTNLTSPSNTQLAPVFNVKPPPGVTAQFSFSVLRFSANIYAKVRSDGDFGITAETTDASQGITVLGATVSLWGTPAASSHDSSRCIVFPLTEEELLAFFGEVKCIGEAGSPAGPNPFAGASRPFLTNPTQCTAAGEGLESRIHVESWNPFSAADEASFISHDPPGYPLPPEMWGPAQGPTGCADVPFDPVVSARPTESTGESPSGMEVDISVPPEGLENPTGIAQSHLKKAVVTLPPGVSVNPSSASGLGSCTEAQLASENASSAPGAGCPLASKIGSIEVETPLLDETLTGSVFLAQPHANRFGSLIALYLVVKSADRGIVIKLPGRVDPDPQTGQLVATFDDNPQLPFSNLHVEMKTGSRAPLITPRECGTYSIETDLYPWARPTEPVHSTSSFKVTSGPNGGACSGRGDFNPSFDAGSLSPIAGSYSPLVVNASRPDGSAPLSGLKLSLPAGLTARLAGTPYCPEAALAVAAGKSGRDEQASSSCPRASRIGTVDVAAGAGANPFHAQGTAYLAGPYGGAPLSVAVITPAVAGPFDLGTVVVRAKAEVDPITARVTISSDPIPTILQGIPLKVRSISVNADRPEFTLNPTSCEPMSLAGTLFGPAVAAPVASPFQVGACKALDFAPRLALRVFGKTNRNSKPRFRAVLQARPGEANIARAQVNLPHSLFLEQNHIRTICTRSQFAAGAGHGSQCPKGSVYGHAKAFTPLLDQPLEGPVYLRSSNHKLPDLVAALNGQVDIELAGKVDSGPNEGIRNTFELVPDAPVSKFVLSMAGGRRGLLVISENLCSARAKRAIVRFTAQNGAVRAFKQKVANGCGRARKEGGPKPKG